MIFLNTGYRASISGIITVLMMASLQVALAYDAPDFEYEIFSADGLFLEKNDRDTLLQALASLASNFPGENTVDSDLREKALALALRIDPLHQLSRHAHDSLLKGKPPASTGFFKESTTISDRLWDIAEKMLSGKPEPEAAKLAPYLMDISLSLSPTPPPDRLNKFARLRKFELLPWDQFVSLQPNTNSSSGKIGILFSLLKMEGASSSAGRQNKKPRPKGSNTPAAKNKPEKNILQLDSASMPALGFSEGSVIAGTLRLNMRKIGREESKRLNKRPNGGPNAVNPIHLGSPSSDQIRIAGFAQIARLTRFRYKDWPANSLALFSFTKEGDSPVPDSLNFSLSGILLMHSVYSGKPIDQSLVFAGRFAPTPDKSQPKKILLETSPEIFKSAKLLKTSFLVLPESAYRKFLEKAAKSGKLGNLFSPQLLSFTDLDDAIKLAMDEPEELRVKAKAAFEEIEAVTSQMSLEDLARNKAVRVRLQKIVADYPRHLSARMMLDFGEEKN